MSAFDKCPICNKPLLAMEALAMIGAVWQHASCAADSSDEREAAKVPAPDITSRDTKREHRH
jgi:hypothetical protein